MNKIDSLLKGVSITGDSKDEFSLCFRTVAGDRLVDCCDVFGLLSSCGISVNGSNEELTKEICLNCLILLSTDEGSEIYLSDDRAIILSGKYKKKATKIQFDGLINWFSDLAGIESSLEEDESTDVLDESTSDLEQEEGTSVLEDDEEDTDNLDEEVEEEVEDDFNEVKESIKMYYNQFYKGVVSELAKRYTSLFESGYEVNSPAGILAKNGLLGLSGRSLKVKKFNIAVRNMYNIFQDKMGFIEVPSRSNVKIADTIYDFYANGERRLLYFPNKLLEYAYGRKAPTGDNKDSVNTYEEHSNSSNWGAYCKSEVIKSLTSVVGSSVVKFIYLSAEDGNYYDERLADSLRDYLVYLQKCLSLCLLMVEYKSKSRGVDEDVYAFKVRVCDPADSLGYNDLTHEIINRAFMGSTGDVPFSYKPRFEEETYIKEYAHEFNHDSSQAMPLFAYKAFLALQNQGVEPTWNNMILGMFEDGTILKNGKRGVSLNNKLTHHICAGSRAGKGVMTLNILASGIYSNRNIFYLDKKPDMASMFKSLSPNMFVVNGASYDANNDKPYYTFQNQDSLINPANIPDYVCNILDCGKSWMDLGDLFYMRALKLVMGIILARGDGKLHDPNFGGSEGILLVVDEFKNFQEGYSVIINKMKSRLPAKSMASDKGKLNVLLEKKRGNTDDEEYKDALNKFNKSYNDGNFYALSYLNSMVKDLEFLSTKRDAGFNPEENRLSDIFVIGQHLGFGDMDLAGFNSMLTSGRYKGMGDMGVKSGGEIVDLSTNSFGYSIVSFKTCDAFFGRNMEDGREVYLAQTNKDSKAYGRLDDKASNFAYMETFTNEKRLKVVGGRVQDNIALANSCIYFKPFLVLNDAKPGDTYTEPMFQRCAGPNLEEPWVTREEIIAENSNADGTFVHEAVGYEGYLNLMGISDYTQRLAKSGDIANYVVQNCLGYNGTWVDFITDLRPQWLFSIKDVVDGARGVRPALLDISNNSIISEFVQFNPELFGVGGTNEFVDEDESFGNDEDVSVSRFMDDYDDYSDLSAQEERVNSAMDEIFDESLDDIEDDDISDDELLNLFDDNFYTVVKEDEEDVINEEPLSEVDVLLNRLKELGVDVSINQQPTQSEVDFESDVNYGGRESVKYADGYKEFEFSDKTEFNDRIEFNGSIESYADLVNLITKDVVEKFGGLEEIVSFKVVGGAIVVNGYYYRCKAGDIFARGIPYDIRREINSGNISRLFNYSLLHRMPRLRDLEFDSTTFVYDYVSYGMGYGSQISVDLFFRDLRALQCLCIGRKLFKRETYMEQIMNDDVFYHPRTITKLANYSEEVLGNFSKSSWEFTKNTMKSKDYGNVMKFFGVTGGLMATGVSAGSRVAVKGTRKLSKGLRSLGKSLKEMLDESKNYN